MKYWPNSLLNSACWVIPVSEHCHVLGFVQVRTRREQSNGVAHLRHRVLASNVKALCRVLRPVHTPIQQCQSRWASRVLQRCSDHDLSSGGAVEMRSADVVESQDCRFANLRTRPCHALAQHEPESFQGRGVAANVLLASSAVRSLFRFVSCATRRVWNRHGRSIRPYSEGNLYNAYV